MADNLNYLYAGRPDPFQSFVQGFGTGQNVMTNISKNQLMQEEANRYKLLTAMKLHDEMKGMAYNNLDFYNNQYKPAMAKLGVPETFLPDFKSVDELNQGLYRNEQIKAMYKQKMEGPKVVPERGAVYLPGQGFQYPEVSPARQAIIGMDKEKIQARFDQLSQQFGQAQALKLLDNELKMGQIRERANLTPKQWRPDLVETEEGGYGYIDPTTKQVTPVPGIRGKAKAGQESDIRAKALKATSDQGIFPGDKGFDDAFQNNLKILAGGARRSQPSATTQFSIPTTGLKEGQRAKGSDGNIYVVKDGQWTKE